MLTYLEKRINNIKKFWSSSNFKTFKQKLKIYSDKSEIDGILKKWPVSDEMILQVEVWMADYVTKATGLDAVTLANYLLSQHYPESKTNNCLMQCKYERSLR